jgi:hypothetical protein
MMTKIVTLMLIFGSLDAFAASQPEDAINLFNKDATVARELKKAHAARFERPQAITVYRAAEGCTEEETYLVVQQTIPSASLFHADQVSAFVTFNRTFANVNNGECDENNSTNTSKVKVVNLQRALFLTEDLGQSK